MKTVGKQLQEARTAKNWTPELAARETKIRVDRLNDLEADDYSNFSSPTYARGFVRTYARSLGLDEYKLLRQLDNKLPEDDNASFANDAGIPYIPEPSRSHRSTSSGSNAGLYVLTSLVFGILLVISFVLFQAYRAGELQRYFASQPTPETPVTGANATNAPPATGTEATDNRAKPVDPNAPVPPAVDAPVPNTNAATVVTVPPVDSGAPINGIGANAAPPAVKALPVDPSELTNAAPVAPVTITTNAAPDSPRTTLVIPPSDADAKTPPRALPVDLNDLANAASAIAPTNAVPNPAPPVNLPPPGPPPMPSSARASSASTITLAHPAPSPTPVPATATSAADLAFVGKGPVVMPTTNAAPQVPTPPPAPEEKRLVLTASRDSFVRVTSLDSSDNDKPLYARVLKSGQSVGFAGKKFSINVGIPSAIDITLDGVNYGPHSDQEAPETFSVESHQP
jgi:cytoskeleton protein RodZ